MKKEKSVVKKRSKRKNLFVASKNDEGVAVLISKVQQQLSAMEIKLDTLISQSSKKPFEKSYSRDSSRSFDRSNRHDRGRQGNDHREKTYTRVTCAHCNRECQIPFKPTGDRPVYCKECFADQKKGNQFNSNRDHDSRPEERDFSRGRSFDKKQRPDKKKKSFFSRRKKRT